MSRPLAKVSDQKDLNRDALVIFLSMTLWKVLEIYVVVYGQVTWKNFRTMEAMSPLMGAFIRDGSIFFVMFVHHHIKLSNSLTFMCSVTSQCFCGDLLGIRTNICSVACSFSLLSGTVPNQLFMRGGLSPYVMIIIL